MMKKLLLGLMFAACARQDVQPTTTPVAPTPGAQSTPATAYYPAIQAPGAPFAAKSACAEIKWQEPAAKDEVFDKSEIDLEGDGTRDVLLSAASTCSDAGECTYEAFVVRGSCGHYVGSFRALNLKTLPNLSAGLRDIEVERPEGCGTRKQKLRFSGEAYAPFEESVCSCAAPGKESPCEPWKTVSVKQ
jgi:hypothetical protein